MGAADYISVPPPNYAAYSDPRFGLALGQVISELPDAYFKGVQQKHTLDLQKPVLDLDTGEPSTDPRAVARELMKRGGAEYSQHEGRPSRDLRSANPRRRGGRDRRVRGEIWRQVREGRYLPDQGPGSTARLLRLPR